MSRFCSRGRRKGQIGLVLLAIVFIFSSALLFITGSLISKGMVTAKKNILINVDIDNRGTELLSLAESGTGESRMVLLGRMLASNTYSDVSDEIKETLDKIHDSYVLTLQYSGMQDITLSKGDASNGDEYEMEIPAPGARSGSLKASVKIKR